MCRDCTKVSYRSASKSSAASAATARRWRRRCLSSGRLRAVKVAHTYRCDTMYTTEYGVIDTMPSTTFTVRVESEVKKRLEKLARSTGRTRSFLAAEALNEYLDVNEWQVAGVK